MKHSQIGYVWSTIWCLNIKKVLNICFFNGVERPKTAKPWMKHGQIAYYWSRISKTVFGIFLPQVLRKLWILNSVGTAENGVGRPKTATSVNETRPDRPRLKQDIQNCLKNFPSFDIKKVTDLASLTVWNRRKRRVMAKNGKTVNETRPDRLRLKRDFQNCL